MKVLDKLKSTNWRRVITLMAVGGAGFWIPDVVLHAVYRYSFDTPQLWMVTFCAPISFALCCLVQSLSFSARTSSKDTLLMLLGVWLTGGLWMWIGASFSGGGFATFGLDSLPWLLASPFPPITLMMSTYDGSLLALCAGSVAALLITVGKAATRNTPGVP